MPGQINRGWHLGDTLYMLAKQRDVRRCLEIGTYMGDGSTHVLAKALAETKGRLWSVELKRRHYACATDFYEGTGLPVELICGLTLSADDYPPFEHYWPRIAATSQEALEPGSYREWYDDEIAHARDAEEQRVLERLVAEVGRFDMVLFDGGEFASDAEFEYLEPHIGRYVVMDDTNGERCIKNAASRERILASPRWEVLVDAIDERNGWLAARKVE